MTNAYNLMGQMAVCCQNLMLGALSSCSELSVLVGALFKKFGLFLNTPGMFSWHRQEQRFSPCRKCFKELYTKE
jgi:hypothetical protein